jgi:hypothetical protein
MTDAGVSFLDADAHLCTYPKQAPREMAAPTWPPMGRRRRRQKECTNLCPTLYREISSLASEDSTSSSLSAVLLHWLGADQVPKGLPVPVPNKNFLCMQCY